MLSRPLRQVLQVVAALRGVSEHDLAQTVYDNTMRVFFPVEATPPLHHAH